MNYEDIKQHCDWNSAMSKSVVDDFIINFAAKNDRLEGRMLPLIKRYNRGTHKADQTAINYLMSEFIALAVFREGGLLNKYLNRLEVRSLPQEQQSFLKFQIEHPWRLSFASINRVIEQDLFEMEDLLSGEIYLLYSPGMGAELECRGVMTWLNLISFNGKCWQTNGLIIGMSGCTLDDLFFFATELNPNIENEDEIMDEMARNPFPFLFLVNHCHIPPVEARGYLQFITQSVDYVNQPDFTQLPDQFKVEWNRGYYQISHVEFHEFPHYAFAYYNEKEGWLKRLAMTAHGFNHITKALLDIGIDVDSDPHIVVSAGMLSATESILGKTLRLFSEEKIFASTKDEPSPELDGLNHFIQLLLPYFNSGEIPDIPALAKQAGIDLASAQDTWNMLKDDLGKKMGKSFD